MPIHGYPGGVITANPVAPTASVATGVWTTEQQLQATAAGNWPMAATQVSLSARFNSADSAYLSRTPASASNRKTWTWSGWVKRTNLGEQYIFSVVDGSASGFEMRFTSGDALRVSDYNPGVADYIFLITSQLFRDVSAWYHIVLAVDTTQATNTNRVKIYVNGSQVTAFSSTTYPNQNQNTAVNTAKQHRFAAIPSSTPPTTFGNFYLAEVNFIDGLALTPAYFGFNNSDTGAWTPRQYTGAYGTNGFYLQFNKDGIEVETLIVAGGGGAIGRNIGGGGGAGGLLYYGSETPKTPNGPAVVAILGTPYTVTVGGGGAGASNGSSVAGSDSVFGGYTALGGGARGTGTTGGSGWGGDQEVTSSGNGTTGQGNNGGTGSATYSVPYNWVGGGGGGAGGTGGNGSSGSSPGAGGSGLAYSISGSSLSYAGGGGASGWVSSSTTFPSPGTFYSSSGGSGVGGAGGGSSGTGGNGTTNRGGGGGGAAGISGTNTRSGGNGGSGVVIIKIPSTYTATFSGGVTQTSTTSGGFKIYTVTATSTTSETVTFS
jgi:hypothetical protein